MLTLLITGFLIAALSPWLARLLRRQTGWWLALYPAGCFFWLIGRLHEVAAGQEIRMVRAWVPGLATSLSFSLDGLSLLFALLISGIGVLVCIYLSAYLDGHRDAGRCYAWLLIFMSSMLGLVLTSNVLTLFVFWELTSLSSYFLIGFEHERAEARHAALQALLVTGVGGLALLGGLVLLSIAVGSFELPELLAKGAEFKTHPLYLPVLGLVLVGALTKSAQFPFHFWLPNAMAAPTPISAYLHAATMVKAGIYLLARLSPAMGGTDAWHYGVAIPGTVTMLLGAVMAFAQTDWKRVLAFTTLSTLGTLTLLLGLDTMLSVKAAVVLLVVHALYKGALFLVAGAVEHEAGTRDLTRLGGLFRFMPVTAIAAMLAALSMAGLPPLLGFIGKELLYEAKTQAPRAAEVILALGVLSNVLLVAVAGSAGIRPFFGRRRETPRLPHEAPLSLWLGPALLAVVGLFIGLFPDTIAPTLVAPAVAAVRAEPTEVRLQLWHGVNPVLLLSAFTLVFGVATYFLRDRLRRAFAATQHLARFGPEQWYGMALSALKRIAESQTRWLQNGYLRVYLLTVMATTLLLAGIALYGRPHWPLDPIWHDVRLNELVVAGLVTLGAIVAVESDSRLKAFVALGVVGFGISLLYIEFGAVDMAITQLLVDTLTVILFVLVFYRLPKFSQLSSRRTRLRDAAVAAGTGGLVTLLVLLAMAASQSTATTQFYANNSVPLAHGRNVVNVILVDFRAFDTLGEITVLVIAAVGVFALLKLRRSKGETELQ
jgi:multicomponent Na+:H+ antiporter subunit A